MTMEPTREQLAGWITEATQGEIDEFIWNVARLAYAAGAEAELEACNEYLYEHAAPNRLALLAARRPKPPNLKQEALDALNNIDMPGDPALLDPIYAALESLPDD